jgi:hypothetical protein
MKRLTQVLLVVALAAGLLWVVWLGMWETEWEEAGSHWNYVGGVGHGPPWPIGHLVLLGLPEE